MIKQITLDLLQYLKNTPHHKVKAGIVRLKADAVLRYGTAEDAIALFDGFVSSHHDFKYVDYLLPVLMKWPQRLFAESLFDKVVQDGSLINEDQVFYFELFAKCGFEPVKAVAAKYALNASLKDYYLNKGAVLALLHLDCTDMQETIRENIEATLGKGLFNEFVPALVGKLHDPAALLSKLYQSGSEFCSTDCNAGMVLGFSLCGDLGYSYFKKVLFDPRWEVYDTGTGTAYYCYEGFGNLNLSFVDFYEEMRCHSVPAERENAYRVFVVLLKSRIEDPNAHDFPERFMSIYSILFASGNGEDLVDLSRSYEDEDRAYALLRLLELRVVEELGA